MEKETNSEIGWRKYIEYLKNKKRESMNKPKSRYSTDSYNPYPKRKSIFKRMNWRLYERIIIY